MIVAASVPPSPSPSPSLGAGRCPAAPRRRPAVPACSARRRSASTRLLPSQLAHRPRQAAPHLGEVVAVPLAPGLDRLVDVLAAARRAEPGRPGRRQVAHRVAHLAQQLQRLGVVLAGEVPDQPLARLPLPARRQVGPGALHGAAGRARGLLRGSSAHPREYAGWSPAPLPCSPPARHPRHRRVRGIPRSAVGVVPFEWRIPQGACIRYSSVAPWKLPASTAWHVHDDNDVQHGGGARDGPLQEQPARPGVQPLRGLRPRRGAGSGPLRRRRPGHRPRDAQGGVAPGRARAGRVLRRRRPQPAGLRPADLLGDDARVVQEELPGLRRLRLLERRRPGRARRHRRPAQPASGP